MGADAEDQLNAIDLLIKNNNSKMLELYCYSTRNSLAHVIMYTFSGLEKKKVLHNKALPEHVIKCGVSVKELIQIYCNFSHYL